MSTYLTITCDTCGRRAEAKFHWVASANCRLALPPGWREARNWDEKDEPTDTSPAITHHCGCDGDDETWTEVVRRIGDDPHYHLEVGPDADHLLVQLRYMEHEGEGFVEKTRISIDPDLVPRLAAALVKAVGELDPA